MKLTLVTIHIQKDAPEAIPLAAAMLKAASQDIAEITLAEFTLKDSVENIIAELRKVPVDAIGFCVYLWNRPIVKKVMKQLHSQQPNLILFAGGPEVTANSCCFLQEMPADFVVCGEGENTLKAALLQLIPSVQASNKNIPETLHQIPGIATQDFPETTPAPAETNLSSFPSPYLTRILNVSKYCGVLWELSRGCPFRCSFCYESKGDPTVRQFPIERLEQELTLFEKEEVAQVFVLDPTFNRNPSRAKQILRLIQKKAPQIHFTFEVRTEFLDRETAQLFASISCGLQIGLQTTNPAVLSVIHRQFDANQYRKKIALLNDSGAIFGLDLIFGLPKDSFADFCKSLDYAITLQPNNLDIFRLAVLPGTALYDTLTQTDAGKGIHFMDKAPYLVIETPEFPAEDLEKAQRLKTVCDIFYNKGRAVGWLYIILETLHLTPSVFFSSFYHWMTTQKMTANNDNEIFQLQKRYTHFLLEQNGKKAFILPICDIITLHHALNISLDSPIPENSGTTKNLRYQLPQATILLELHYDVDALYQAGVTPLKQWIHQYHPEKTFAITWQKAGNSDVMMIDSRWFSLLHNLQKVHFSNEERDFLDYCVEEGILILC